MSQVRVLYRPLARFAWFRTRQQVAAKPGLFHAQQIDSAGPCEALRAGAALDSASPWLFLPKDLHAPPQRAKMGAVLNHV